MHMWDTSESLHLSTNTHVDLNNTWCMQIHEEVPKYRIKHVFMFMCMSLGHCIFFLDFFNLEKTYRLIIDSHLVYLKAKTVMVTSEILTTRRKHLNGCVLNLVFIELESACNYNRIGGNGNRACTKP